MHAYLIITKNPDQLNKEVQRLQKENHSKVLEFPMQKIDDARSLNSFLKLSASENLLLLIKNFQNATEECANAILKNLEEPQENVAFAIQASNDNSILPTIKSRCKIIRLYSKNLNDNQKELDKFLKMDISEKFNYLESYKTREEALQFSDQMLSYLDSNLTRNIDTLKSAKYVASTIRLKKSLEANGNLRLHILRYLAHLSN